MAPLEGSSRVQRLFVKETRYLVLAMEALSRLLISRYDEGSIGYHPRTENLTISHLMFADDVMIFFDGSGNSLHGISECLDGFASWSGLHMNNTKTEIFTAG